MGAINDVEYYDDSKGTNVGATVAALNGLGKAFTGADQRLVVILGGDGKGQDFDPLADPVARYARAVLLIGRDAALVRAALAHTGIELEDCGTDLPQAVLRARDLAQAGDSSTASPAWARSRARSTACGRSVPQSSMAMSVCASAARINAASRPISSTARA